MSAVGQAPPGVEGALRRVHAQALHEHVAPAAVDLAALATWPWSPVSAATRPSWSAHRHAGGEVVEQQADAPHELRVADREADPPAGHPVDLRRRPQLDRDVARAVDLEHAARAAPVEGQEAVGEVVEQPGAALVGPRDGGLEGPRRLARRARVGGVVEDHERRALGAQRVEVGLPAGGGVERQRHRARAGEGDGGEVVGIAGVGQRDRLAGPRAGEHGEHDPGLRPGHDRDLAVGIELDAVVGAVALGDRLAQLGAALERRVAVHAARRRELGLQRLERERRRRQVGVAAPEVDQARARAARAPRRRRPGCA